jgi:uncharacterized protein (TIGR03000 family)
MMPGTPVQQNGGVPSGDEGRGTKDKDKDKDKKKGKGDLGDQGMGTQPARATLVVSLPADAKLVVDGHATTSSAAVRRFSTPPLEPGREYYYTLQAEIPNEGKVEVVTQRVIVRAGEETRATLSLPVTTARSR